MSETPTRETPQLLDRLENYYDFECEGGPLRNCVEWHELKARVLATPDPEPLRTALEEAEAALTRWANGGPDVDHDAMWALLRMRAALSSSPVPVSPETCEWRKLPLSDFYYQPDCMGDNTDAALVLRLLREFKHCPQCGKPLALPSSPTPEQEKP